MTQDVVFSYPDLFAVNYGCTGRGFIVNRKLFFGVIAASACSVSCMAQTFDIEGAYGLSGTDMSVLVYQPMAGPAVSYTIPSPNFVTFRGVEWDGARDRVVVLAIENNEARIATLNSVLDPASFTVIRSGLDVDASQVDVDPATGRVYWWENGQILSVESDGTGVALVEADNVSEPIMMEIDIVHDRYFILETTFDELEVGALGVPGSPQSIPLFSNNSGVSVGDVDINSVGGDLYWTEWYVNSGSGLVSRVLRANSNGLGVEVVYENDTPQTDALDVFYGIGALGDRVGVNVYGLPPGPGITRIIDLNLTTGSAVEITSEPMVNMDVVFSVSPILQQPESTLVEVGEEVLLNIASFDQNASFQWRRSGVALIDEDRVSGSQTDSLTIINAQLVDTNAYTCFVVTSTGGSEESEPAIVAVRGNGEAPCVADLTDDGVLDFFDISAFIQAFAAGCP